MMHLELDLSHFPYAGSQWRFKRHLGVVGTVQCYDRRKGVLFEAEGYPSVWVKLHRFLEHFTHDQPKLKVVCGRRGSLC